MQYMDLDTRVRRWARGRKLRSRAAVAAAVVGLGTAVGVGRVVAPEEPVAPAASAAATFASTAAGPLAGAGAAEGGAAWDLPNLDHPRVDYFVEVFTGRQRKMFTRYLTEMGRYQPMISAKLAERGMPQDLIYLAMIESGFDPTAYSRANASGLWQFIADTGRRYGLDINRAVDERRDPEKATDAALDYLQDLHDRFGSWYLAAAAYNSGEGRVSRVMRAATGSVRGDEESYYRISTRLPKETRDYVPLMIAAARIAKEPEKYGFEDVVPGAPDRTEAVVVRPATPLAEVAQSAGTSVDEIRRLNPELKLARTRNDEPSLIRVPAASTDGDRRG
ncbi:MAG: lytic transglycosylase domain-containing protein [Gemmatimonadota bacterium]